MDLPDIRSTRRLLPQRWHELENSKKRKKLKKLLEKQTEIQKEIDFLKGYLGESTVKIKNLSLYSTDV